MRLCWLFGWVAQFRCWHDLCDSFQFLLLIKIWFTILTWILCIRRKEVAHAILHAFWRAARQPVSSLYRTNEIIPHFFQWFLTVQRNLIDTLLRREPLRSIWTNIKQYIWTWERLINRRWLPFRRQFTAVHSRHIYPIACGNSELSNPQEILPPNFLVSQLALD